MISRLLKRASHQERITIILWLCSAMRREEEHGLFPEAFLKIERSHVFDFRAVEILPFSYFFQQVRACTCNSP